MRTFAVIAALMATLVIAHGHRHGHGHHSGAMKTLSLLCAPDTCVPRDIKDDILSSWTDTGNKIWTHCLTANGGKCSYKNMMDIGMCGYQKLMNTTDITVAEARDTIKKVGWKGLETCCGNTITLKMLSCAEPPKGDHHGHHGHHGPKHHGQHHHEHHRHHHGEHRPTTEIHYDGPVTEEEVNEKITMFIINH